MHKLGVRLMRPVRLVVPVAAGICIASLTETHAFDLTPPAKSLEEERAVAASQHQQILAQFGGEYENSELSDYVSRVGERVAAASEMPERTFRFTVLNSPVVNAFTVGGGYVYVTRGILASINSEAELAALLGHEIGHVTARHTARRETRMQQDRAVYDDFERIADSFRALSFAEVNAIPVPTVSVVEVADGDSLNGLAEVMLGSGFRIDRLKALSGIEALPPAGERLKIIVDGRG